MRKIGEGIFDNLFVLELSTQHLGSLERGIEIVDTYAELIKKHNVHGSIKLQLRDVDTFIHKDHKDSENRYIKKTLATKLPFSDYKKIVDRIKFHKVIASATPFDETSVETCEILGIELLKIASSDISDHSLLNVIAKKKKPTILSTAGATLYQIDEVAEYFYAMGIPLAINHCIALYPTEISDCNLHRIDELMIRYPENIIGWSSHEGESLRSLSIAYSKGARTFEKHIDIMSDNHTPMPYCSTPEDIDRWFQEYHVVKAMCGNKTRLVNEKERGYISKLWRGLYAKKDLKVGTQITPANCFDNFYLAIPWIEGNANCNDILFGKVLDKDYNRDEPIGRI